jgi:endonuclease/exonuclease/phosphatase family metal-dependent hydrolase
LRREARNIQKRLEEQTAQTYAEVAALKEATQRDLQERQKAHAVLLKQKMRAAQDLYSQQLAIAEKNIRHHVLHTLTEHILQHVRDHHIPPPEVVDFACLSDIGEILKDPVS